MENRSLELLVIGLRNAHSMEYQAKEILERQIARTNDYPELKRRLQSHLEETKEQIERLETCLAECDASSSAFKDTAQSTMGNVAALAHAMANDEVLKNMFANNALENYEAAAYKSLLVLCTRADMDFREPLEQSLEEELAMARWVDANIEAITEQYLRQSEPETA